MTRIFLALFLILLTTHVGAQTADSYRADLDRLHAVLQQTPSYQAQITGNELTSYRRLYDSLRRDTANIATAYEVFYKLVHLFFPVRDNHLGFYQLPASVLDPSKFTDAAAIAEYKKSKAFLQYPQCRINTDSLERALKNKPEDSVEGIYYYDRYLKVGLFRANESNRYLGVVLSSALPHWEKGQIAISLYEQGPAFFRAVYGHPVYKGLMLYNNERYLNGSLAHSYFSASVSESVYRKHTGIKDHATSKSDAPEFEYKTIRPSIQYIRLGNFSAMNKERNRSQAFYDRIKDSLTAPNLIVDLRNNTGGSDEVSRKYLRLIEAYARTGNVFVLINSGTMSEGERFTLRLKRLAHTQVFGQTTRGTIAYGSNYGKTETLPSGNYQVYLTDMQDRGNYLRYESVGIPPDLVLKTDADWIEQVVHRIEGK